MCTLITPLWPQWTWGSCRKLEWFNQLREFLISFDKTKTSFQPAFCIVFPRMLVVLVWGNWVCSQHVEWLKKNNNLKIKLGYIEIQANEIECVFVDGRGLCLFGDDTENVFFFVKPVVCFFNLPLWHCRRAYESTSSDILTVVAVAWSPWLWPTHLPWWVQLIWKKNILC